MFCDHLKNVIGGCKKERQAILHTQHVQKVHDHMDPNRKDENFESLLHDGGLQFWKKWAKPLLDEKQMRPGSVRSYLLSLAKFFEFVEDHVVNKVSRFPNIPDDIFNRARSVVKRLKSMSSSINKKYVHLKWEKRMQEEANALPVSIIQEMLDTEPAMEAMRYLTLSYSKPPTERMFLSIRDFLLARLEIENCQRPGSFETATLEEFQLAKKVNGKMVMSVSRHKTSKSGPAPITMCDNTYSNVKAYVQYVRCHFADKEEETLFVTREGNAFLPGTLGKRIKAWWKQARGHDVTSTQLRKVGSTERMKEDLQTQIAVQALMTHRRTTAEDHYQILNRTKQAVKGHAAIAKNLGLQDTQATVFPEDSQDETVLSPSKSGLAEDQLEDIDLLFSEQINTNAPLSMTVVRNVMSESVNLVTEVKSQEVVRRVYNRVKYLQKKQFEQGLNDIPDENDQLTSNWVSSVCSAVSGPTRRMKWSTTDVDIISKAFTAYDKCPPRKEIHALFESVEELIDIAERNTMTRCYEKVKTIFRQRRNSLT